MLEIDPEKIDGIGQSFADLGVDEADAAAEQNLAARQATAEYLDAFEDHRRRM